MSKSIAEIKKSFDGLSTDEQKKLIISYRSDDRKGVQTFLNAVEKKHLAIVREDERLEGMMTYEYDLFKSGVVHIAGIDEVGRGPLAGPVVTCAVVLKDHIQYRGINDSKKVSLKNRERLYNDINANAVDISFGEASPEEIDELNILNATKLAMKRAIDGLKVKPDHLLVDAVKLDVDIPQTSIIKGDEKSITIAAASIMAKVNRDQQMQKLDDLYSGYDFSSNKGYGTAKHYEGLNRIGISPIHRKSFVKDFI